MKRHGVPQPSKPPIVMLHGIQSHPGWFVGSADMLAGRGRAVYQMQRRGSGDSLAARGHADSPAQLLADLDAVIEHVQARSGADRVHLVGISWGGKYAACYALHPERRRRLTGLTLVAPGICPRVAPSLCTKLAVAALCVVRPRHPLPIPLDDPALFTDNAERRAFIENDPLRLHLATARFMLTSRRMDWMLARAAAGSLDLPVNLLLARRDRIIDNVRTEDLLRRQAGGNLRTTIVPGAHTLEFEADPQPFFDALAEAVGRSETGG